MTDRQTLSDLLEKVRACEGADREVDRLIVEAFGTKPSGIPVCANILGIGAFTSSVDAALALVERVLPGWWWAVGQYSGGAASANVSRDGKRHGPDVMAPTPALALLAALLTALLAEEAGK